MISIIITAYKEKETIGKAIQAFLDNNIKEKYEIIVLAPDKETIDEAKKFSNKFNVRVIKDPARGKPSALNLVFSKAKGEILIMTDGDVWVDKNAVKNLLKPFSDSKIGAVSGHPMPINSKNNMFGFWSYLLTSVVDKIRKKSLEKNKTFFCSGYLFAMRKGIITQIPENTLSDDGFMSYLIYQKGYKISYSPEAKVYVKFPTNFKDWINQKKRSVGGYNQIKKWTNVGMRSFTQESSGIFSLFEFIKTPREFFWFILLCFARVYLWILIYIDINLKKKSFDKIWVRIDSTK